MGNKQSSVQDLIDALFRMKTEIYQLLPFIMTLEPSSGKVTVEYQVGSYERACEISATILNIDKLIEFYQKKRLVEELKERLRMMEESEERQRKAFGMRCGSGWLTPVSQWDTSFQDMITIRQRITELEI